VVIIQNTETVQLHQKKVRVIVKRKTKREDNAGYLKNWQETHPDQFKQSQKNYDLSEKGKKRHRKAQKKYISKLKARRRRARWAAKNPNYWKDWRAKNKNKFKGYQEKYGKSEKGKKRHRKAQEKYDGKKRQKQLQIIKIPQQQN